MASSDDIRGRAEKLVETLRSRGDHYKKVFDANREQVGPWYGGVCLGKREGYHAAASVVGHVAGRGAPRKLERRLAAVVDALGKWSQACKLAAGMGSSEPVVRGMNWGKQDAYETAAREVADLVDGLRVKVA